MRTALKKTRFLFFSLLILSLLTGCEEKQYAPLPTVSHLDLTRYGGLWHEIARYENRFEEGCVGATAAYTLQDKHIRVINRCYDDTGRLKKQAEGKAYPVEGGNNAKLRVTFFWPFYGDYWVLMLADDYRYAVIGDPARRYLWILARDTVLSDKDRYAILSRLPGLGYDPFKLYWTGFKAMCNH